MASAFDWDFDNYKIEKFLYVKDFVEVKEALDNHPIGVCITSNSDLKGICYEEFCKDIRESILKLEENIYMRIQMLKEVDKSLTDFIKTHVIPSISEKEKKELFKQLEESLKANKKFIADRPEDSE